MSKLLVGSELGSYTFNTSAATITLLGLNNLTIDKVLEIYNATTNQPLYISDDVSYVSTISSNVISLSVDVITLSMTNSDKLRIYIDYPDELIPLKVGGKSNKFSNTITTSNGTPYSAGDNVGGIITLTDALRFSESTGMIKNVSLWSKENQVFSGTIDYWDASPSGTYTNNSTQVIAGDEAKWIDSVSFLSTDFKSTGTISTLSIPNLDIIIKGNASANIFYTIKTTSSGPSYTSTSGLIIKHGILQD